MTRPPEDMSPLLTVARVVDRSKSDWQRFLIEFCAAWHFGLALPLAFAPIDQIVNAGTQPVFDLANRYQWAATFLLAGVASLCLRRWPTPLVQCATWLTVLPLGGAWLTAFALAVFNGRGSAIGVTVWLAIYGLFAVLAWRIALGKR